MNTSTPFPPANASNLLPTRRALPHRQAGQELLIRDPASGQVHFLNATASVVWECCDGNSTLADCERRLRAAFTIPSDVDVTEDIRTTIATFHQLGLIDVGSNN